MSIVTAKMLLATLQSMSLPTIPDDKTSLGTISAPRRYTHKSESDREKEAAKRKEIAEWNERVERNRK